MDIFHIVYLFIQVQLVPSTMKLISFHLGQSYLVFPSFLASRVRAYLNSQLA